MKLYLVFEYDQEGSYLCDIFTDQAKADAEANHRNVEYDKHASSKFGEPFRVEEWEIQE